MLAAALTLLAAACAPKLSALAPGSTSPKGLRFVPEVVDIRLNAGPGLSVAVSSDGTPDASYFRLDEEVALPLQPVPEDPTALPAVMVATRVEGGLWVRQVVLQEREEPAEGEQASGPKKLDGLDPETDATDIAVDGNGARHVVWTVANGTVQYATDAGGAFPTGDAGEAETVAEGSAVSGAAVAVAEDGTPWVSYYEGTSVRAASRSGTTWTVEEIGPASAPGPVAGEPAPPAAGQRTDVAAGPDGPIVVYGDGDATMVATRGTDGTWTTEEADGDGGFGAAIALDADGNPHLAYYSAAGDVRHAHRTGAAWSANVVSKSAAAELDARTTASIALSGDGTHWVAFARTAKKASTVWIAENSGGDFAAKAMPDGAGGARPAIAAVGDHLAAAWYDTVTTSLLIAPQTNRPPPVALPSPPAGTPGASPTTSPTATGSPTGGGNLPCEPNGTDLQISAQNIQFDTDCLAAPAGKAFTVTFTNKDEGVPHNWEAFTDQSASQRIGGATDASDTITTGSVTYDVDALDAGQYYFHCDVHPTMSGTLVVA